MSRATAVALSVLAICSAAACDKVPLLAPTQSTIALTMSTTTLPVNGTAQVIATVIEQPGTPVQNGTVVTFTGSLGHFDPPEAITQNGKATTTFRAGGQSGTAKIGAVSGGAKATEIDVLIGGAAAAQVVVRAEPSTVPETGGTTTITASVTDSSGNPLAGAPVTFSATTGTLSSTSAITDSNGDARVTLQTSRDSVITAAVGGKSGTASVKAVALPNVTITIAAGLGGSTQPEAGIATTFTITPTTSSTGNRLRSVVVDFGDGTAPQNLGGIAAATNIVHTYARPGQYTVTALATDVEGLQNTSTLVIQVNERSPLTVTLSALPNPVSIGNTTQQGIVDFSATASGATGGLTYYWSFGDGSGTQTTGGTTNHRYTAPGTYTASVTVRASNGTEGYAERTVRVNP